MKMESLILGLALSASAAAAPQYTPDPQLASRLDVAVDRAIAEQRIVGTVVLVARDGKIVYRRAAGLADREHKVPMRDDAIFLFASVTKPIVTAAAMRLVEQGVIGLHDPVTRWLPDFKPKTAQGQTPTITTHQLLTHTAGLSYDIMEPEDGPYRRHRVSSGLDQPGLALEENLKRIVAAPLAYEPGKSWGYSASIDVLGAVLEKAARKPLPEIVQALVTKPLDMRDTAFAITDLRRLVTHYSDGAPAPFRMGDTHTTFFNGAAVNFAPRRLFNPDSFPSGGAGMAGSAMDVLTFLESLRTGGRLLRNETITTMRRAHVNELAQTQGPGWGFGYGGAILIDPQAAGTPQSKGTMQWGGAYGHNWFIDPEKRLTVVALTNTAFEGMAGKFTVDVRNAVYGTE